MARVVKRIGLSLGADVCWPVCYEELLRRLDLHLDIDGHTVEFEVDRMAVEPFALRQPRRFDLVIDRLTHWYYPNREWIKKAVVMDDLYVLNNPWTVQSMEKHTGYCAMMRLGLPVPDTWLVPPKSYELTPDLEATLREDAQPRNLGSIGDSLGYPAFMKPYDGGAWVGVSQARNRAELHAAYDASGTRVMHVQKAVLPHEVLVHCIGVGPQLRPVKYERDAPPHNRYLLDTEFLDADQAGMLEEMTLTINSFFGWEHNACEALFRNGTWYPIDFANACPDSHVTSLHYHFPWLLLASVRWSVFCAATGRRMRMNPDWSPYLEIADGDLPFREKLRRYAAIAHDRFETERFRAFCATHLAHLDEVAWDFFGSETAREAVRDKVSLLYPSDEQDRFTELVWRRIQHWREGQSQVAA